MHDDSNHCIVSSPERKVRKGMQKRKADPRRGTHFEGRVDIY